MGGALLLAAALGLLGCLGWWLATAIGLASPWLRLLAAYLLGWTGLVGAAAVLSLPGWLDRWSLAAAIGVLAAGAFVLRHRRPRPPPASAADDAREALADSVVALLAVAVVVAGVYLGLLAVLTTPNDWDGLTYHETRALLWDQQGRVAYVLSGNDPRLNGNPPASELGLYLTMLLPRSERFAALPQYLALWASVLAVVLAARRIGLTRCGAAYAGLVFATLPVVLLHGAAVLNDLLVASFLLAAVVFLAGRTRTELALGALALGLALSTKLNTVLALPVLFAAVLAAVPRSRRKASAVASGVGVLLGSPWYLLNAIETGSLDGDLGASTGQSADHSFGTIVGSLRALSFDVVDTSGFWKSELYLAVVVGAALAAVGVLRLARGGGRALVLAGLVVGLTPVLLRVVARPLRYLWEHAWFKLGREDIALDHGDAWKVLSIPDTSLSWYGAAGAVIVLGGVVAAAFGVRRGRLRRAGLVFAVAPLVLIVTFALTIVYDPWRGRLAMFAVGLACAAWGWTIRIRWLAIGTAVLCITTTGLSLVHSYTKPSGLGILHESLSRSVWHRDRIDTLTVIRNYDGTPALLREVEARVPSDAVLAVATPIDTFLAPLAGPHLSRTLRLVRDGRRVPPEATWLVTKDPAVGNGCPGAWEPVFLDEDNHWRLLRRIEADACREATRI